MTKIVVARGTSEAYRSNMIMGALKDFAGSVEIVEAEYPAEIRPLGTHTLTQSLRLLRQWLKDFDAKGEPWVGVGYSLGAMGLGDSIEKDGIQHCLGIVQIADPLRSRTQYSNRGVSPNSWGCAGERRITHAKWESFAIPDDPITSCPGDNGFRSIADLVTGLHQPLPAQWWNAGATLDQVMKYLLGNPNTNPDDGFHLSRHVAYGVEKMPYDSRTYMQAAADVVADFVS